MATRQLLAELVQNYQKQVSNHADIAIHIESVGGVDATKRVQTNETFDVVFLASDAIDKLIASGHIAAQSKVDLAKSGVGMAVKIASPLPDISCEAAVKTTVLAAKTIGYSTGPSGIALAALFGRWGIADQIAQRILQAPPGMPVGSLVARGEVELGFQQLSELIHLDGISIVGLLPPAIQITTTFSGGIGTNSKHADAACDLLTYMASPAANAAKLRQGMEII